MPNLSLAAPIAHSSTALTSREHGSEVLCVFTWTLILHSSGIRYLSMFLNVAHTIKRKAHRLDKIDNRIVVMVPHSFHMF